MSDFLNGFRFESATPPPSMTWEEINALLAKIETGKKRVVCASDVFEQVRTAVYGAGYGIYFKVIECSWMNDGQVVLMRSEAEEQAETQQTFREALDETLEQWARNERAAWEARQWYGAAVHQPKPFSPIITGL